ncbi:MAG: hypothetical protein NW201_05925 [Gemmatimonadales bacterium]|nr:hypothetical protein [Gemmatimonadales bacterium]
MPVGEEGEPMRMLKGNAVKAEALPVRPVAAEAAPEARVLHAAAADGQADPWGARRAEELLTTLDGILKARVVTSPLGEITEVHVLAKHGLGPKQIVRNIESALLAQLGVRIDHRKVSIAQTADVRPIEVLEREVVRERALARALLFEGFRTLTSERPHRVIVEVTVSSGGRRETAHEEVPDTPRTRVEAAARATVMVLDGLLKEHAVALEGAKLVDAFERQFVLAAVNGLGGRQTMLLTGTAEVRESPEQAAALAVLDATNRWLATRRED